MRAVQPKSSQPLTRALCSLTSQRTVCSWPRNDAAITAVRSCAASLRQLMSSRSCRSWTQDARLGFEWRAAQEARLSGVTAAKAHEQAEGLQSRQRHWVTAQREPKGGPPWPRALSPWRCCRPPRAPTSACSPRRWRASGAPAAPGGVKSGTAPEVGEGGNRGGQPRAATEGVNRERHPR